MTIHGGPNITKGAILLRLDAADIKSYVGTNTEWRDRGKKNKKCSLSGCSRGGNKGGNFTFNGSNSSCVSDLTVAETGNVFSVCCWFSKSGHGGASSTSNRLISADRTSGSTRWCVGVNSNGNIQVAGTGGSDGEPSFSISNNVIYFYAFIMNSNSYSFFLNETKQVTNRALSLDANTFGNVGIGCRPNSAGDRVWNGEIYTVTIYDRAIDDEEVLRNYYSQNGRFG